ncbi:MULTISPECIES: NADP(H)-dependent aldo-keto reductase [unclassified Salinivibrio]|uniref:NADP(H)-dependent aldo-keto reductase n=1 Tax=unclassified Salinivibrio TaxID=2636825 RepID=UPI00128CADE4|nr:MULTISPECIES: NADP(H)-dependent aldo-keto reductase [unclassified Salinivibrio]MPS33183.1 NADP(H)-dependent aldo-keto reductase [Salinivibrio sp. VYel7]MPX94568.1 NADP(H)-dependent aldo-keto reductase [Salinivibrio sp. VYel9]MPX97395.1 NADP(H)-dependent aldo-keto reductase [Salinivibrio sp. VYel6]MPY00855.1 NADP(H)-dependent aldo-keto reductase [Salinivibrio sp. VYel4]MPY03867.1 NADP(H)-dependent aldo-keto reductase [Salinivibrio sp. VYel5]
MQYHRLPHSSLEVSKVCLGTMTFGEQNSEADAHAQLDLAFERGVNFIDTAEMYPVPPSQSTQGLTEQYIGSWLEKSGKRDRVILATKVAGPRNVPYIRDNMSLNRRHIHQAVEDSLTRLKTDYIDLYQVHWPQRHNNCFGKLNYPYQDEHSGVTILDTLDALHELVQAGKIRYIGVSNETPWGVMRYLHLAEKHGLTRIVSIQNPYNLLNRTFEVGLSEISHHEGVELLAYSPLAFGALSGKYLQGARPKGARCTLHQRFARYFTESGQKATQEYVDLAQRHGLDPAKMALAFVNSRPFVASNIIGATTLKQLESNLDSLDLTLSDDVLAGIDEIANRYPNPCP